MPVYLDHAAGGPLHPIAREAMMPWLTDRFGNPSGSHQVARAAREAIDTARDAIGELVGVEGGCVVFTSGGTESDNLAVLGAAAARPGSVVVSAVEHPAVIEAAIATGLKVRVAPVDCDGIVDPGGLRPMLDDSVALVSVQTVNHETGVIQPLNELMRVVRRRAPRALFHTDAVQAAAWLDLRDLTAEADLVSISSHKLGGPQGAGALVVQRDAVVHPVVHGGGQEREMRSGTQNVAAIVGFAAAAAAAAEDRVAVSAGVGALRNELAGRISEGLPETVETSAGADRVPGHLHVRFPGVESEALLVLLDERGVCASAGAACASGALEPSPVLMAMGVDKDEALCSLRLTLGYTTTAEDVDIAAAAVIDSVRRLRGA